MKTNVYTWFASLCSDLGLTPSVSISEEMLQRARNALLVASESVDSEGYWDSSLTREFQTLFALCFPKRERRYSKPWRVTVFRDAYQALCFVLKVETEYTPEQERIYLERFQKTEADCRDWRISRVSSSELLRLTRHVVRLAGNHWDLRPGSIANSGACRHGPGAVRERHLGSDKNVWSEKDMPYQLLSWSGHSMYYANSLMESEPGGMPSSLRVAVDVPSEWLTFEPSPQDCLERDVFGNVWVSLREYPRHQAYISECTKGRPAIAPLLFPPRGVETVEAAIDRWLKSTGRHTHRLKSLVSVTCYARYETKVPTLAGEANASWGNVGYTCLEYDLHHVPDEPVRTGTVYDRVIARLNLVPKDWKGPRGVFISPKAAVWCQLGIWETIRRAIPQTWLAACYSPNSQVASQEAAFRASSGDRAQSDATLDLSDASDRIPATLVKFLFHPQDWAAFQATRPSAVEIQDQSRPRKLYMFAPMGDGKTFPILTIVCAAICVAVLLKKEGYIAARAPSEGVVRRLAKRVRIFGDDIIVPSNAYAEVCDALEVCNLKVNRQKSFVRGYFRESCGMDAYRGHDVTPLRLRFEPHGRPSVETVAKAVDLHNRIYVKRPDMHGIIKTIERYVQRSRWKTGYTHRPDVCPGLLACPANQVLQRNWEQPGTRLSYNIALQRFEYGVFEVPDTKCLDGSEPWWDLNNWLLTHHSNTDEIADQTAAAPWEHGDRKVVTGSPITERGWDRLLKDSGCLVPEKQDIICRPVWVPLPSKVMA